MMHNHYRTASLLLLPSSLFLS